MRFMFLLRMEAWFPVMIKRLFRRLSLKKYLLGNVQEISTVVAAANDNWNQL